MISNQVLNAISGSLLKQWWEGLSSEKCGYRYFSYAIDEIDRRIYSVCMGWHGSDTPVIAWKIGCQPSVNATQCDFDTDFEAPRNPETGEADDALTPLDAEPIDWDAVAKEIRAAAARIARSQVRNAKADRGDADADGEDDGELTFTDDAEALNGTTLQYQWSWLKNQSDGCCHVDFARSAHYRYCVCFGWHDDGDTKRLTWKIGRIHVQQKEKFGFDDAYKTVGDSVVALKDENVDWDSLARDMAEAITRFKVERETAKGDK